MRIRGRIMSEKLFDEAKAAAGRLCFDANVDKSVCRRRTRLLVEEIEKMLKALGKEQG